MKVLQDEIKNFCKKNKIECSLESRMLDLLSELGEVAKEILVSTSYGKKEARPSPAFAEEIGDLQFSLIALANEAGIDLEDAVKKSLSKYSSRLSSKGHAGSF